MRFSHLIKNSTKSILNSEDMLWSSITQYSKTKKVIRKFKPVQQFLFYRYMIIYTVHVLSKCISQSAKRLTNHLNMNFPSVYLRVLFARTTTSKFYKRSWKFWTVFPGFVQFLGKNFVARILIIWPIHPSCPAHFGISSSGCRSLSRNRWIAG